MVEFSRLIRPIAGVLPKDTKPTKACLGGLIAYKDLYEAFYGYVGHGIT